MHAVRREFLQTPGGQIHYRFSGMPERPPVLLFHESPVSGQVYETAMPLLAEHFFVLAPDTPGYGDSEAPAGPLEIPGYAERMAEFAQSLGLGRFAVVGAHTGASIAIELARQAPNKVSKLVLMGVALYTPEDRQHMLETWTPPFTPVADGSHLQWLWQRYQRIWGAESPPELLHSAVVQFLKAGERYRWAYQAAFRYDPALALPQLEQPVLFLVAEHDLLADKNEWAVSLTKNAQSSVVPGLLGQLPCRVPQVFASTVAEFLRD